ncbi:MAG: heavy-metal-associated domain-containing protein [Lacipirellulaceae bacterium]
MRIRPLCLLAVMCVALGCGEAPVSLGSADPGASRTIVGEAVQPAAFNSAGAPTVAFDVPDMVCEHMCAPKVRETLAAQPGVVDVKVDVETKLATVAVDEALFDAEKAVAALVAAEFAGTALHAEAAQPVVEEPAMNEPAVNEPTAQEKAPKTES